MSPLERDMRRRLFHGVYNLDRLLGHALGRPPSIPDDYVNVPVSVLLCDGVLPPDFSNDPVALLSGLLDST